MKGREINESEGGRMNEKGKRDKKEDRMECVGMCVCVGEGESERSRVNFTIIFRGAFAPVDLR